MIMGLYDIYKIENIVNGKVYIGKTSKGIINRFNKHINNASKYVNRYLYDAMNFYGYEKFIITSLYVCLNNSHANLMELYYIKKYNSANRNFGYNMTSGGDGGVTGNYHYGKSSYEWWVEKYGEEKANYIKKECYKKVSEKLKKRYKGMSFVDRFGDKSEKIKEKISNTLKEKGIKPPIYRGGFNKNHRDDSKEKMSMFRKGKTYEEIYGVEKAMSIKNKKSINFKGENNPNYRPPLTKEEKIFLLESIISNIKLSDISLKLSKSLYELRKYLKSIDINNLQKCRSDEGFYSNIEKIINEIKI